MIELGFDCANEEELQVQEDTNYYEWCALRIIMTNKSAHLNSDVINCG